MMKKKLLSAFLTFMVFSVFSQVEVGRTKYDLQTNNSPARRLAINQAGEIVVTYTCSHENSSSFSDRGTGYNYSSDNGATWSNGSTYFNDPFVREDSMRTGWPNIVYTNSKEVIISHTASGLQVLRRDLGTTNAWDKHLLDASNAPVNSVHAGDATWARAAAKGDSIFVVFALPVTASNLPGMDGGMLMYRSYDAGDTWNGPHEIPEMNSTNFKRCGGDRYAIDVNDNGKIAIVLGTYQVEVLTSTDWGNTFTKQTVVAVKDVNGNPAPLFDGLTAESMDTVNTSDRSYSVIVDDNDKVHVWFGRSRSFKTDVTQEGTSYLPLSVGIMYWNDGLTDAVLISETEFTAQQVGLCGPYFSTQVFDQNANSFGNQLDIYFSSLVSMPSAGYDENGNIFVAYSSMKPATFDDITDLSSANNLSVDLNHFRDIMLMKSSDNGVTWEGPFNLSDEPLKECVYPSVPRKIFGTEIPIMWQEDIYPGTNLQSADAQGNQIINHPVVDNNIVFTNFDISLITTPLDLNSPIFTLIGLDTLSVIQNSTYVDPGYDFVFSCETMADTIIVDNVNNTTLGTYTYTYTFVDVQGNSTILTRYVTVIATDDVAPNITITGNMVDTVEACSNWTDLGATAYDNISGDITNDIITTGGTIDVNVLGNDTVFYTVTDAAGNYTTVYRIVVIVDTEAPEITIGNNISVMHLCRGETFTSPTASATDCITSPITVTMDASALNTNINGFYNVIYTAVDDANNTATKTLTVKVGEAPVPDFTFNISGQSVGAFDNSSPIATTWDWNWGDGSTHATTKNPSHAYSTDGNYDITLIVTNDFTEACGISDANQKITKSIVISGIREVEALNSSVDISPNPSNGIINVTVSQKDLTNVKISIFNEIGDLVIAQYIENTSKNNSLSFDLGENASGIYFVNITTEKASTSKKVLIK